MLFTLIFDHDSDLLRKSYSSQACYLFQLLIDNLHVLLVPVSDLKSGKREFSKKEIFAGMIAHS